MIVALKTVGLVTFLVRISSAVVFLLVGSALWWVLRLLSTLLDVVLRLRLVVASWCMF